MRIYLDNCCYNRPYDDQSQLRISLEAQAKIYVQQLIKDKKLELVSSLVLTYENSKNRFEKKRLAIQKFTEDNTSVYIGSEYLEKIRTLADEIMKTGVKSADAAHTACAILAGCDYMLTTDDRLLKYKSDRIQIINPTEFVRILGGAENE